MKQSRCFDWLKKLYGPNNLSGQQKSLNWIIFKSYYNYADHSNNVFLLPPLRTGKELNANNLDQLNAPALPLAFTTAAPDLGIIENNIPRIVNNPNQQQKPQGGEIKDIN